MKTRAITSILLLSLTSACSTFQPENQTLQIKCDPNDIILKVNGDTQQCPCSINIRRDRKILVEGYKAGYTAYSKTIDYHLSKSAKLDAVGTVFLFFPIFGLLSPGAWDLDETQVSVVINKL